MNQHVEELFGYTREELIDQPVEMLVPERFRGGHGRHRDGFFLSPEKRSMGGGRDLTARRKDGSEFPVEIGLNPIQTVEGRFAIGSVSDITARKQSEDAVRAAHDAAESANLTKSEFLANMSHELRTPLNSVIGFSTLLLKNKDARFAEKDLEFLGRIRSNGEHLLSLINDVLDISKVEAGQMEIVTESVQLAPLVDDVVRHLVISARARGLTLAADTPADLEPVQADALRFKQVLINLTGNALKFTHQGGVTIRVLSEDGRRPSAVEVVDTGVGIPNDKLAAIFDAFRQADASTTRDYGGTGLGLTISRSFCRLMGFELEVESQPGIGSVFRIGLSAPSPAPTARDGGTSRQRMVGASRAPTKTAVSRLDGRRILVVDDDEAARVLLGGQLEELGCVVETLSNGPEALARARTWVPDLVTVDLMMPGMSGLELINRLRADEATANIPVVVISFVAEEKRRELDHVAGVLNKPVDLRSLKQILHETVHDGGRVLIVEDDADARELLVNYLREAGCRPFEAENGAVALERLDAVKPDLILLDLMMPLMDGFAFLEQLRRIEAYRAIPVVVVTAKDLSTAEQVQLAGLTIKIIPKGGDTRAALHEITARLARAE